MDHVEAQRIIKEYKSNTAVPSPQDANLDLQSLINTVNMLKEQFQQPTNCPLYNKTYNKHIGGRGSRGGSGYQGNGKTNK